MQESDLSFFKPNKTSKYSYEQLTKLISARLHYLLQHTIYLRKILKNEIEPNDIRDYFRDVFNQNLEQNNEHTKFIAAELIQTLNYKVEICTVIYKAMNNITDPNLLTLYIVCKNYLQASQHLKQAKQKKLQLLSKILATFNDKDFYSELLRGIEIHLPDSYTVFKNIFKLQELLKQQKNMSAYIATIEINWHYFLDEVDRYFEKEPSDPERLPFLQMQWWHNDRSSIQRDLDSLKNLYHIAKKLPFKIEGSFEAQFNTIKQNVDMFYQLYPVHLRVHDFFAKQKQAIDERMSLAKDYQDIRATIIQSISHLDEKLIATLKLMEEIEQYKKNTPAIQDAKIRIIRSDKALLLLEKCWPSFIDNAIKNDSDLEKELQNSNEKIVSLNTYIENLYQTVTNMLETCKTEATDKQSPEIRDLTQTLGQTHITQLAEERKHYLAEQAQKLANYKEKVRVQRELKQKTLSVQATAKVEPPKIIFKNLEMTARLENLSAKKLALLRRIVNKEPGILFSKVKTLIIKGLQGKVEEIGNGSSHKRIELDKCFIEVTTHADIEANSKTVGGFYKPHGGSHNPGELSTFNIGLVQNAFAQAGITLKLIDELIDKKNTQTPQYKA